MQPTDDPSRYKTNPQPKWEVRYAQLAGCMMLSVVVQLCVVEQQPTDDPSRYNTNPQPKWEVRRLPFSCCMCAFDAIWFNMQPTDDPSRYKTNPQLKWEVRRRMI
jgi:hypothetical protein